MGFESVLGKVVGQVIELVLYYPGNDDGFRYYLVHSPRTVLSHYIANDPANPFGNNGIYRIAYEGYPDWYVTSGPRGAPARVGAGTNWPLPPMPPTEALVGAGQEWITYQSVTGVQLRWRTWSAEESESNPRAFIRFDSRALTPDDLPCDFVRIVCGTNLMPEDYVEGDRNDSGRFPIYDEDPPGTFQMYGMEEKAKWGEPPRKIGGPYYNYESKDLIGVNAGWGEGLWIRNVSFSPIGLGHIRLERQWSGADVSVPPPLRVRQRGDGLGTSVRRVKAPGSRQASPRVRGYL